MKLFHYTNKFSTFAAAMPLSLLPSLLLAILLVGYTPEPANLFSLHCSMKNGVRKAMTMWLGLLTGFTIAAVFVAIITHLVGAMMGKYVVIHGNTFGSLRSVYSIELR